MTDIWINLQLGVEMSVYSLICWLSDLLGISDVITLWSQISLTEFSSICSFDFGWDRSTLSQIELWWPKLVTLCSTGISFWTVQTCGWGIMEISEIILFWTAGTLCLSMLFCAGDWLKCLLPILDSCTFRCFIECLQFESLSALLGGHKSGHS